MVRGENKRDFVESYIEDSKGQSGIIYAATRKEVDNLYEMLRKKGYSVGKYHAGLSDEERVSAQEAFIYDDIRIMVATNAFGMGIDKSNVRFVIHYNMPKNMESYYQEAGRAGRDGESSECILLFGPQDVILQKFLIEQTTFAPERRANEFRKLQVMVDYCHTPRCLRKYILEYFGEIDTPEECENCSSCKSDVELSDITVEAQKIFSCIYRMKGKYGTSLVADVLKGSKNKRIIELGFDNLTTYGLLKEYSVKEIKDLINLLVAEDYLCLVGTDYPVVKLKEKCSPVLKGDEKVFQRVVKKKQKAEEDNSLFEMLRSKRRYISELEKVPPYVIFSDSTLHEMCKYCPVDENSMLSIKGVGETKLLRYGAQFMEVIKQYFIDTGKVLPESSQPNDELLNKEKEEQSHVISLNMYKKGASLKEIARLRELKEITVQDHLIRCSTEGLDVDLSALIPKGYEDLILKVIKELGGEKLKPIKDALPDDVDYMAIKAVLCKYAK